MNEINRLLKRLCDAEIDFVIVGGFAAVLHGSSLLTRDLDVCTVLTRENVSKLREIFRDVHPVHRLSGQKLSFLDNPAPELFCNCERSEKSSRRRQRRQPLIRPDAYRCWPRRVTLFAWLELPCTERHPI